MMKKVKINEDLQEGHTLYEYRGQWKQKISRSWHCTANGLK